MGLVRDPVDIIIAVVPILVILGGVLVFVFTVVIGMWQRGRLKELAHRERIAMIEKGLIPPPEVDPARFERLTGRRSFVIGHRGARHRSIGITILGLGVALMVLIAIAFGEPTVGIGVGGAVAILGIAAIINASFLLRQQIPEEDLLREDSLSRPPTNETSPLPGSRS